MAFATLNHPNQKTMSTLTIMTIADFGLRFKMSNDDNDDEDDVDDDDEDDDDDDDHEDIHGHTHAAAAYDDYNQHDDEQHDYDYDWGSNRQHRAAPKIGHALLIEKYGCFSC